MKCYVYYKDASMKDFKPLNPNYEPTSVLVRAAVVDSDDPTIRKELIDGTIEDNKGKAFVAMQLRSCDNGKVIYSRSTEDDGPSEAKQKKCSMAKKIESLGKKNEAFTLPRDVADAMKLVKSFLEKNEDAIVDAQLVSDADAAVGYQIELALNVLTDLVANAPKGEAKQPEAKKSEAVDDSKTIKMNVDYNTFMRLCSTAAYLTSDENYWDALWEYYSDFGEITEDANVFFDNLFQYTDWKSEEDLYDESLPEKYKDDSKSKAECIEAAVDAGDLNVFKTDKGYLVIQ